MELQDAVKIVKAGNLKDLKLSELWEVEQVLRDAGDTVNLAAFWKAFSPNDMKAADAAAKVEIKQRQTALAAVKDAYVEDKAFKKGMDNFWNGIEITNDKDDDKVEAGELRRQIEKVSAHEAEKEILEGHVKPEDYKKLLQNIMSTNCVQLVAVSTVSEMVAKGKELTGAAAKDRATEIFTSLFSAERKEKVQVSGKAAIGFLTSKVNSLQKFANRLADHTGLTDFAKKVKDTDKKLTKVYPKAYPFAKNLAKTGAISVLFGGIGISLYSAWRLKKTFEQQRMAAEKENKSYWEYLKSNKEQIVVLGAGIVSSFVSLTGMSMENMGLTSQLLNADAAKDVADASVTTASSAGFSWRGAWEGIKNNFTNGKYLLRTGAATAASIAIASKEYSKLYGLNPDSPEYKAQRSKARKVLAGSALGTLIGLTTSAAIGGMHGAESHVAPTGTETTTEAETKVLAESNTPAASVTSAETPAATEQNWVLDWNKISENSPQNLGAGRLPDNYVELPQDTLVADEGVKPENSTAVDTLTASQDAATIFPQSYSPEMGITHAQYSLLQHLYKPEDLDRMYMNLSGEGVMEHFEGMTKEEVLFKYQRLDAYTDRVDSHGNSIQGAVRYHYEEEMTAINKLLNCGDPLTNAQYEAINKALAVIDDRGGYHGPGRVPTNSVMISADPAENCGEGHMNHWKLGHRIEHTETETHTQDKTTGHRIEHPETDTRTQDKTPENITPVYEDMTVTSCENLKYEASFEPVEYQTPAPQKSTELYCHAYGKNDIKVGQTGVEDIYVTRGGERIEVDSQDDLKFRDKLVVKYTDGLEKYPAKKFAGFETTETTPVYKSYTDDQVTAEAEELKEAYKLEGKPTTLTKLKEGDCIDFGVGPELIKLEEGDYIKVTKDGIVCIDADPTTGKAVVNLRDFDGKPMNAPIGTQNRVVNETVKELNDNNCDKKVETTQKVPVEPQTTTKAMEKSSTIVNTAARGRQGGR